MFLIYYDWLLYLFILLIFFMMLYDFFLFVFIVVLNSVCFGMVLNIFKNFFIFGLNLKMFFKENFFFFYDVEDLI